MTLLVKDILQRMKKQAQPELKEKFRARGLESVEFGLTDRALMDLSKEMGPQPFRILVELWDTGFYECRWLVLLAVEPKDLTRAQVEAWGKDLQDKAQAQCLAGKISNASFVPRRLKDWLQSESQAMVSLAEEWLWAKVKEAEVSSRAHADLAKIAPRVKDILLQEHRAPYALWTRIEKVLTKAANKEKFTAFRPLGED